MADFQFFLNRQGPRGPQGYKGDKGDDGKTPVPRTGTNTPIETTVIFDTGDGNPYETPNLKYPIEDRGGNMVMLDRTNNTQYYGTPDQATDDSYGVVKLATPESVLDDPLNSDVVTYELFDNNNQDIKTVTDGLAGDITQLNTDLGSEVTNRTNADTQLTNKINTDIGNEATARSNADTALSGRIDNLTTSKANKSDVYTKTQTDSLLNNKSNVGHTHNYNEITNKPDIGNGTITITQGGVVKGSFTTNQLSNSTIALDAGGGGGGSSYTPGNGINITNDVISVKVDNDSIYVNQDGELVANLEDITEALGAILDGDASIFDDYYTKAQSDSRYVQSSTLATVATSGSYNDLSNKPTIPSTANMVTIDTDQTITGVKKFQDSSGRYMRWQYGNLEIFGHSSETIHLNATNSSSAYVGITKDGHYLTMGQLNSIPVILTKDKEKIYRGSNFNATLTDFILEKDMLDGTTIQYNNTSGKVEVIGGGSSYTLPTASTSTLGGVKIDGSTITVDSNGVISAASSTPSNMVTTNTSQTITGQKTFDYGSSTSFSDPTTNSNKYISINPSGNNSSSEITLYGGGPYNNGYRNKILLHCENSTSNYIRYHSEGRRYLSEIDFDSDDLVLRPGSSGKLYKQQMSDSNKYPILDTSCLDGTYLIWDSTNNKITVDIQAIKDAIDALSNSSGTVSEGPDLNPGGWE